MWTELSLAAVGMAYQAANLSRKQQVLMFYICKFIGVLLGSPPISRTSFGII
jgi:phosphate/sulfate permease